jgi:hypothetical protein
MEDKKVVHLDFFKEEKGPVSRQQYDIRKAFINSKLIKIQSQPYFDRNIERAHLTKYSLELLDEIEDLFLENEQFTHFFNEVIEKYGNVKNARDFAQNVIYPIEINGKDLFHYKNKEFINFKYPAKTQEFVLDQDWIESLVLYLNPDTWDQLNSAVTELYQEPKTYPYEPL